MSARAKRGLLALMVALSGLGGLAGAQQRLLVDGSDVAGASSSLVPGTAYAPAAPFASAIGAAYALDADRGLVSFELAGRVVVLELQESAAAAAAQSQALWLDGERRASTAALLAEGEVFVPVRSVAAAFGGSTAFISELGAVTVVFPRADLLRIDQPEVGGSYERIVLTFDAAVPIERRDGGSGSTFRFGRARTSRSWRLLAGEHYQSASLVATGGGLELQVSLSEGSRTDMYAVPNAQGVSVVVDVIPARTETGEADPAAARVVIDPGDSATDGSLTLALAQEVAAALSQRGVNSTLTRSGDGSFSLDARANAGVGADLFLSLHAVAAGAGQFNLYYLGEAATPDSLTLAIRRNAESEAQSNATDSARRRILLGLTPDLPFGESLARRLSDALGQQGALRQGVLEPAPLYVLGGAAGRGVLLELSQDDLRDEATRQRLAAALAPALLTSLREQGR